LAVGCPWGLPFYEATNGKSDVKTASKQLFFFAFLIVIAIEIAVLFFQ
jgi:hypothetical protein